MVVFVILLSGAGHFEKTRCSHMSYRKKIGKANKKKQGVVVVVFFSLLDI